MRYLHCFISILWNFILWKKMKNIWIFETRVSTFSPRLQRNEAWSSANWNLKIFGGFSWHRSRSQVQIPDGGSKWVKTRKVGGKARICSWKGKHISAAQAQERKGAELDEEFEEILSRFLNLTECSEDVNRCEEANLASCFHAILNYKQVSVLTLFLFSS